MIPNIKREHVKSILQTITDDLTVFYLKSLWVEIVMERNFYNKSKVCKKLGVSIRTLRFWCLYKLPIYVGVYNYERPLEPRKLNREEMRKANRNKYSRPKK